MGKFAKLVDSDKESIYNEYNSKKYIYDYDDSETVAIAAEGTVITVTFREAEKYYAVLNCYAENRSYTGPVVPTMIIFNNGDNGQQTSDLVFVNGGTYNADGVTTGINAVAAEKLQNAVIYNLAGQRVQNARKGLYIVNGRKVVVK